MVYSKMDFNFCIHDLVRGSFMSLRDVVLLQSHGAFRNR